MIPEFNFVRQSPEMIQGLKDLCQDLPKDSTIVEIGSYVGESTVVFAEYFKKVIAVDPWVWICDEEDSAPFVFSMKEVKNTFDERTKSFENIEVLQMTSKKASLIIPNNSIDVVYIDAKHHYKDVKEDISFWYPKLKSNGYLCGHDYTEGYQVALAVDEFCKPHKTYIDRSFMIDLSKRSLKIG